MTKSLFERVLFLYVLCFFIQPERIISLFFPALKIINGFPTILFFLIILLWLLESRSRRQVSIPVLTLVIVFVFCMGISSIFARNTGRARQMLIPMIYFLIFYYIIISQIDCEEKFWNLLKIYIWSAVILSVLGLIGGGKIANIPELNDENQFGAFFAMFLSFPAFLATSSQDRLKRYFYFCLTMLCIIAVVVTASRGASIGLFGALIYLFVKSPKKSKIVLGAVLVTVLGYGVMQDTLQNTRYGREIRSIFSVREEVQERSGTAASRIFLWKMGMKMFAKSPVIGVGPENFGVHLPDYAEKYYDQKVGLAYYGQIIHNDYLELLVGTGILGLTVFLSILLSSFRMNQTTRRMIRSMQKNQELNQGVFPLSAITLRMYYNLTFAIEASQVCYMICMFFYGLAYYKKFFWSLLLISTALYVFVTKTSKRDEQFPQPETLSRI